MSDITVVVVGDDVVLPWAVLTPSVTTVTIGPDGSASFTVDCQNVSVGRKSGKIPRAIVVDGPHADKVRASVSPAQLYIDSQETIVLTVLVEQLETIPAGDTVDIKVQVE